MILSTHAIVGGALASFMPAHPAAAFVVGMASHYAIDAIPHGDYPLRSISIWKGRTAITSTPLLLRDLFMIASDAAIGIAITLWLYAGPGVTLAVLSGAIGAILPDPLRLAYRLFPREPLRSLQRFHVWMHTKNQLKSSLAVISQTGFVLLTIGLVEIVRRFSQ
jgi:hypothetical protein